MNNDEILSFPMTDLEPRRGEPGAEASLSSQLRQFVTDIEDATIKLPEAAEFANDFEASLVSAQEDIRQRIIKAGRILDILRDPIFQRATTEEKKRARIYRISDKAWSTEGTLSIHVTMTERLAAFYEEFTAARARTNQSEEAEPGSKEHEVYMNAREAFHGNIETADRVQFPFVLSRTRVRLPQFREGPDTVYQRGRDNTDLLRRYLFAFSIYGVNTPFTNLGEGKSSERYPEVSIEKGSLFHRFDETIKFSNTRLYLVFPAELFFQGDTQQGAAAANTALDQ